MSSLNGKKNEPDKHVKYDGIPYLRIGTEYFKIIQQPLSSGDKDRKIIPWNKTVVDEDHGKTYRLNRIPKYDSFCLIPDHLNYKREVNRDLENGVNGAYNLYEPISWVPANGEFSNTMIFLKHIFGEQLDIGLDFLTIIFRYPTQILPILCLVSNERNTGKTTFLNWLKSIYKGNMTINTNEDFRNQFNSGWTSKLIIGVDEVLLDKKEDAERIKNLSTTKTIKSEAKGRDKIEQEFFGKFILCSNNETDFIKIPPDEIRFWIRKVPTIENENIGMLKDLNSEIPFFLKFLSTRIIETPHSTRMWFTPDQLFTNALREIKLKGTTQLEREIKTLLIDQFLTFQKDELKFTPKDILNLLKNESSVYSKSTDVIDIVKGKWGYEQEKEPKYYHTYHWLSENNEVPVMDKHGKNGRYYTFKRCDFIK
ncbi:primase-helicase family protein [Gaoshiqia sp. Z1-71]|uniref:primase-helicase family protein n=1 Tax=Gaoshiqia hydrogeniformans TaxID=3290090 RepID=UPI003BF8E6AE